ncbi:NERD domain-containing protein, partial [Candidatus Gracilibacteria bacterium]|nr:NERD domain-containing protein [Candidatus Gracilibacteria bacterium]
DELRPPTVEAGAPVSSALPAGAGAVVASEAACVWTGNQFVGKRYDDDADSWISVVVDGTQNLDNPEVLVVLEQVAYCDDEIRLTWSVRNESERAVEFPLSNKNIQISDGMGNEYLIADAESEPQILEVAPGEEARGTAIVPRALSHNAASLRVRLKDQPFGEASFLVALGN